MLSGRILIVLFDQGFQKAENLLRLLEMVDDRLGNQGFEHCGR